MSKYTDDDVFRDRTSQAQKERQKSRKERRLIIEQSARAAEKSRRKRLGFAVKLVCFLAVAAAVIFTAVNTMDIFALQEEKRQTDEELAGLQHKKEGLEEELELVESDEYVEQQARSELRMIYNGEVLYVVKDGQQQEDSQTNQVKP